jgi:hypothetical protein
MLASLPDATAAISWLRLEAKAFSTCWKKYQTGQKTTRQSWTFSFHCENLELCR